MELVAHARLIVVRSLSFLHTGTFDFDRPLEISDQELILVR